MRLEFFEWQCGARGAAPKSIDGLTLTTALQVLKVLSHTLDGDDSCRARLIDGDGAGAEFHITARRVIAT